MKFYLGTHKPAWLARPDVGVPLFVSRNTLKGRRTLPRAVVPWALDSGGFTELSTPPHVWRTTPEEYLDDVARFHEEIGQLAWAAPQDSMCEPWITAATGRTVAQHQADTVDNLLRLWELGGRDLGIVPVLQGWTRGEYLEHVRMYAAAGVDLTLEPLVGVGSVCRRENTLEALGIFRAIADEVGPRLHGFGLKGAAFSLGIDAYLASADSLAWSFNARRNPPLPGCRHGLQGISPCNNCHRYALAWRGRVLDRLETARWIQEPLLGAV